MLTRFESASSVKENGQRLGQVGATVDGLWCWLLTNCWYGECIQQSNAAKDESEE